MSKIKNVFQLIKRGKVGEVFKKAFQFVSWKFHCLGSVIEDKKIGNISVNETIPSKYEDLGAYATQSTDYKCLKKIFKEHPLKDDSVFVDAGCGEGRVLTYLYSHGFKGRIIGIELDPDVCITASKRTAECKNIEIICSNILDCNDIYPVADVYYLSNPFKGKILVQLLERIETYAKHPVTLYYCNDIYKSAFENRLSWKMLHCGVVKRSYARDLSFSIYQFTPPKG